MNQNDYLETIIWFVSVVQRKKYIFYSILQHAQFLNTLEIPSRIAKHSSNDFSFDKSSKSLVQPKVLVIGICHQISRPTVWNLVSNDTYERLVTGSGIRQTNGNC